MTDAGDRHAPNAATEWFRQNYEAVKNDLMLVVRKHWIVVDGQPVMDGRALIVSDALVDVTASVCAVLAEGAPTLRGHITRQLEKAQVVVATPTQPRQQ